VSELAPTEREVLLALADDEHLMGQRHTEWIGVAPFLEEDLAFASIGQDELGHAAMLYELLGDDADALAFQRAPEDYRSCWLVEAPCTDWADALVRHFLYDEAELLRWTALQRWPDEAVRAIAERALAEETYHRRHAHALLTTLSGDPDALARLRAAYEWLAPLATALVDTDEMRERFSVAVAPWFGRWMPAGVAQRSERSADFADVYARMREVLMLDPTAHW
jgi:ring-1,2-phenylacetyl-CoA epoxidase subunit PaaC